MKAVKTVVTVLCLGTIFGLLAGFVLGVMAITDNHYFQYKMYRIIVITLRESINRWVMLSVMVALALSTIFLLYFLLVYYLRQYYPANAASLPLKIGSKLRILLACLVCSLLFFLGGWTINHYWLPDKFHPMSLATDAGIFLITTLIGWVIIKGSLESIASPLGKISLASLLLLLILNMGVFVDAKMSPPDGSNVVLIVVDTLRADHVGCYGYKRNTTPNIDRLASKSTLLKNATSTSSWTTASVGSIITSQYPSVLGIKDRPVILDDSFLTLAEMFRNNNYETKGIISHLHISSLLGFDQGFESYDEEDGRGHGHISSPSITEKAINFLTEHKKGRFFLFLHYFDPHYDYIMHEKFNYFPNYTGSLKSGQSILDLRRLAPEMTADDIQYLKALYDSEINFTDLNIGKLLDKLRELKLYDETLIVFTADHGEAFLDRGDNWIGHAKTLFQEQIHVPLIIKSVRQKQELIIDEFVGHIDLMPTIVHYSGLRVPDAYHHDGNMIDLDNPKSFQNSMIFSETQRRATLQTVIYRGWKTIYDPRKKLKQVFNLHDDPQERKAVVKENDELLDHMEAMLAKWNDHLQLNEHQVDAVKPSLSENQKRNLRSLGYL